MPRDRCVRLCLFIIVLGLLLLACAFEEIP